MRFVELILVAACAPALFAQTLPTEFEVATIRPHKDLSGSSRIHLNPGGHVEANNVTLKRMITGAYDVTDQQVVDGPDWVDKDRWDVEAKAEGLPAGAGPDQVMPLVRKLLEDRFHVKVRREMRQMPVYQLLVDRTSPAGAKMKVSTSEGLDSYSTNGSAKGIRVEAQRALMPRFAQVLSTRVGRAVVDRTGLTGHYDFVLEWMPEMAAVADGEAAGPSIFTALRETLGLRLEAGRDVVEVLVIEHAERPGEN